MTILKFLSSIIRCVNLKGEVHHGKKQYRSQGNYE